ncbi:MAG: hypothetical protein RIT04_362 [Candidatus Parcubacteria bacterium]|jgi:hypothetical protein
MDQEHKLTEAVRNVVREDTIRIMYENITPIIEAVTHREFEKFRKIIREDVRNDVIEIIGAAFEEFSEIIDKKIDTKIATLKSELAH